MNRFNAENTSGYTATDLAVLIATFAAIVNNDYPTLMEALADHEPRAEQQAQNIEEQLLAAYDDGLRGDDLIAAA